MPTGEPGEILVSDENGKPIWIKMDQEQTKYEEDEK